MPSLSVPKTFIEGMKMRILRVINEILQYQYFLAPDDESARLLRSKGIPKAEGWLPPEVYIQRPLHKEGTLYNWERSALIFPPHVATLLMPYIQMAGEALPLPHDDKVYTLFNITKVVDCLDMERTKWRVYDGLKGGAITRYVFDEDRLPASPFFKLPNTLHEVLLQQGHNEFDEAIFDIIKEHRLEGIKFEEVWRSDDHEPKRLAY